MDRQTADSSNSPSLNLPTELIIMILEYSYYKNDHSRLPDYATLAAASLVHRTWTSPAQALLFRYVTYDRCRRFYVSLLMLGLDEATEHLVQHVRILEIGIGLSTDSTTYDLTADALPVLLGQCSRLYGLMLRIRATLSLEASTFGKLKELADCSAVYLRAIEIIECSAQCPILYQLLSLFPTVRFLSIGCEISGIIPSNVRPQFSLFELKLTRSLPAKALAWLLANSQSTLTVLDTRDPQSNDVMPSLKDYAPYIRSLRMMIQSKASADFVRSCQSLVDLTIIHLPIFVTLDDPPPSIQYLTFVNHTGSRSLIKRIISMIPKLPRLKLITCDEVSSPSDPLFPELSSICKASNIAVKVMNIYSSWRTEEPVVVHKFPRCRSISDFSRMNLEA